ALYYAQAAWEYKHNNPKKVGDWTSSSNKIYSPTLNTVFADAFYDVGWMKRPEGSTAPALAFETTNVVAPQTEGGPAVEPSPIAANKQGEASSGETLALGPAAKKPNAGMEIASADATAGQPTSASSESSAETSPQPQQPASESPPVGGESTTTAAQAVGAETPQASSPSSEQNNQQVPVQTSPSEKPAAAPAPANVSSTATTGVASRRLAIVGGLLLAAIIILAWVIVPVVRRHAFSVPRHLRLEPPAEATAVGDTAVLKPKVAPAQTSSVQDNGFVGGPRQVSVELKPWQAPLRHSAVPARKPRGAFNRLKERRAKTSQAPARREPDRELTPVAEPDFESSVGQVVEQTPEILQPAVPQPAEMATVLATTEFAEAAIIPQPDEISGDGEGATFYTQEPSEFFGDVKESALPSEEEPREAA